MASLLPEQCRAARALLDWQQRDLAQHSKVSRKSIADFERGRTMPWPRTLDDLREAFEAAGIEFLDDVAGIGGVGVRMQAGHKPFTRTIAEGKTDDDGEGSLKALDWQDDFAGSEPQDPELVAYWSAHPQQWARLSETGKRVLNDMMFGSPEAADEAFGLGS
jgi:transcriptional regulator with XRE-family HTH domain